MNISSSLDIAVRTLRALFKASAGASLTEKQIVEVAAALLKPARQIETASLKMFNAKFITDVESVPLASLFAPLKGPKAGLLIPFDQPPSLSHLRFEQILGADELVVVGLAGDAPKVSAALFTRLADSPVHFSRVVGEEQRLPALLALLGTEEETARLHQVLSRRCDSLDTSIRLQSALARNNVIFIGDVVTRSKAELLRLPDFSRKILREIYEILAGLSDDAGTALRLGMKPGELYGWQRPSLSGAASGYPRL